MVAQLEMPSTYSTGEILCKERSRGFRLYHEAATARKQDHAPPIALLAEQGKLWFVSGSSSAHRSSCHDSSINSYKSHSGIRRDEEKCPGCRVVATGFLREAGGMLKVKVG